MGILRPLCARRTSGSRSIRTVTGNSNAGRAMEIPGIHVRQVRLVRQVGRILAAAARERRQPALSTMNTCILYQTDGQPGRPIPIDKISDSLRGDCLVWLDIADPTD